MNPASFAPEHFDWAFANGVATVTLNRQDRKNPLTFDSYACAILPRIIGQGRASELLFTGRVMSADEGGRWGFHNHLVAHGEVLADAQALVRTLAAGPTFAHGITKTQLATEWAVGIDTAIDAMADRLFRPERLRALLAKLRSEDSSIRQGYARRSIEKVVVTPTTITITGPIKPLELAANDDAAARTPMVPSYDRDRRGNATAR